MSFKENLAALQGIESVERIVLYQNGCVVGNIPNAEGKRGSLAVYANLIGFENGTIAAAEAEKGLKIFDEIVADSKANPGKHPNIDHLLAVTDANPLKAVIEYKIPADLQDRVAKFTEMKKNNTLMQEKPAALQTFNEVMDLLEAGFLRTAQFVGNGWQANSWVKNGVMLGFPLGGLVVYNSNADVQFVDKETFPLRKIGTSAGFRVVPPAAGLRRGAYAGKGCTFMPPGYANVGAYIGQRTMVENLAGSCCQVGRDCHISAGAIIGGVLDPIEATPVIIGDFVLLGEGSGITQGSRLDDLVTLAPGVHISKATPVLDPIKHVAYTSKGTAKLTEHSIGGMVFYGIGELIDEKNPSYGPVIPRGALIIPGVSRSSNGSLKATPMIAKYIGSPKERAYALEEALRG